LAATYAPGTARPPMLRTRAGEQDLWAGLTTESGNSLYQAFLDAVAGDPLRQLGIEPADGVAGLRQWTFTQVRDHWHAVDLGLTGDLFEQYYARSEDGTPVELGV